MISIAAMRPPSFFCTSLCETTACRDSESRTRIISCSAGSKTAMILESV